MLGIQQARAYDEAQRQQVLDASTKLLIEGSRPPSNTPLSRLAMNRPLDWMRSLLVVASMMAGVAQCAATCDIETREARVGGGTIAYNVAGSGPTAPRGAGLTNPASQNCGAKGGTVTIEKNGKGDQFGVCVFPDNLQCEEWAMLRGDCRTGGIKVAGFVTPAARYCAITGGIYTVRSGSNTSSELGTCAFKGGKSCDAGAYFAGACSR